ncbi:hypothetical protein N9C86_00815, partial [Schleiferiaceae bacterium]|nr:hypothetical protein [Schleiferiaceae bacterium]
HSEGFHQLRFEQGEKSTQILVKRNFNLDVKSDILKIPENKVQEALPSWSVGGLYIYSCGDEPSAFATLTHDCLTLNYDIVFTVISILNRLEEYDTDKFDVHGRFMLSNSVLQQNGLYRIPIVDYIVLFLRNYLQDNGFEISDDTYEYTISCDVDNIHRYKDVYLVRKWAVIIIDLLKRPILIYRYLVNSREFALQYDNHQNFDYMLDLAQKHGLVYTFNFIVNNTSIRYDYRYKLSSEFSKLFRLILANGHNVGLHFSYDSLLKGTINKELDKFWSICKGYGTSYSSWRFHYLRFVVPDVFRISASGYTDTSFTFPEAGGFRCGTCHSFTPFNFEDNSIVSFRISPLVVMEGSLLNNPKIGYDSFEEEVGHLINECKKVNGNFSLLWHNSDLNKTNKLLFENTIKLIVQ